DARGSLSQRSLWGQERQPGAVPVDLVMQAMAVQYRLDLGAQLLGGDFGGITEVELQLQRARDNVSRSSAGLNVRDLARGWRKIAVALIPLPRRQLQQRGSKLVYRIARKLRVGDVPLFAKHP